MRDVAFACPNPSTFERSSVVCTSASLGWDERFAAEFAPYLSHPHCCPRHPGRPRRRRADRRRRPARASTSPMTRRRSPSATGSRSSTASLDAVLPRRTAIVRAAPTGESVGQALVANIDHVLIAVPSIPSPRLGDGRAARRTRLGQRRHSRRRRHQDRRRPRIRTGYRPRSPESAPGLRGRSCVSALSGEGMASVAAFDRPGHVALPDREVRRRQVDPGQRAARRSSRWQCPRSGRTARAGTPPRHRELIALPGGGVLIDTPGLRGVGMWIADDGVAQTFPEIDALLDSCRFTDCAHVTEPGCAVLAAVSDGTLPQRRLDSWRKLGREAEWIASRNDARLRAQRSRAWKQLSAEVRRSGRIRP